MPLTVATAGLPPLRGRACWAVATGATVFSNKAMRPVATTSWYRMLSFRRASPRVTFTDHGPRASRS